MRHFTGGYVDKSGLRRPCAARRRCLAPRLQRLSELDRPNLGVEIDLTPGCAQNLVRPRSGEDREFQCPCRHTFVSLQRHQEGGHFVKGQGGMVRSEEHTSELQSHSFISYA